MTFVHTSAMFNRRWAEYPRKLEAPLFLAARYETGLILVEPASPRCRGRSYTSHPSGGDPLAVSGAGRVELGNVSRSPAASNPVRSLAGLPQRVDSGAVWESACSLSEWHR